jgi:hypothetical protein
VRAAADLGPRRELSGAPLAPIYPVAAAALAAGSISSAHARVIRATLAALPGAVEKQYGPAVEKVLVERAQELPPHKLAQLAEDIRDALDPDGSATDEKDRQRRRELTLRPSRDGGGLITGYLTPETLAVWQSVLDTLAAPLPAGEDGITDTRTAAQRAHDGFHEAGMRLLRSGDLPDVGGTPVTVLLTVSAADLAAGTGVARTAHGGRIRIGHTSGALCNQALCGEATLIGVELDTTGGILSYGTARRLASPAQRRALAARDRGCSFPGCTRPHAWAEVHHVKRFVDGGETSIDQMTLLCAYHHREFERRGWAVTMIDNVPHWRPPAWLDPEQKPRRNTANHPPLEFRPI